MKIQFWGATEEVTGSCILVETGGHRILLDCGLFQGSPKEEQRNRLDFPFTPQNIDAVILSHAHIDHSGRIPLLVKSGYKNKIYTHHASRDLCKILLLDSAYLNEKDVEIENRKRARKGLKLILPLYDRTDVQKAVKKIKGVDYNIEHSLFEGVKFRLRDAGHILGSSIVELIITENGKSKTLCFSGDLGHPDIPILQNPYKIKNAEFLIMETTYGDRQHKPLSETVDEMGKVIECAYKDKANILIPSFSVGRSQELLYLLAKYYNEWHLNHWQIFLDSPMAIAASQIYQKYSTLYDTEASTLLSSNDFEKVLPGLHMTQTPKQSMQINRIKAGAIIIAGSGMCNGGRIKHHLKHNIWKRTSHIIFAGFQARGTPGRALVDGSRKIRLWGETINVAAQIHTIGGLSAHADKKSLLNWYSEIENNQQVYLVHGERGAMESIQESIGSKALIPRYGDEVLL